MYQIVDWEKDIAGNWRIRVAINGETVMFKFDEWPEDETLQAEAARYDAMMQAARTQEQDDAATNSG